MSNPLAPTLIAILEDLSQMVTTITTGDPAQVALRFEPALQIFLGQLTLLIPGLEGAGLAALQTDVNTKIAAAIAQLKTQV